LIHARTTQREGQADRRHGLELAHQNYLIERRADAYVELLEHINLTIAAMHFQMVKLGLEPLQPGVPPSGVAAEKWSKMVALVRAFASEPLRELLLVLHNTDVKVAHIVATQVIQEEQAPPSPLTEAQRDELRTSVDSAEILAKAMARIIAGELQDLDWDIQSHVANLPGYAAAEQAATAAENANSPSPAQSD
jgi:hypothetical protein